MMLGMMFRTYRQRVMQRSAERVIVSVGSAGQVSTPPS
jgi:hypothetical protein